MIEDPSEFDDPAFRAAVHRAMGSEHAPSGLRRRIAGAIAAEQLAIAAAGADPSSTAAVGRALPRRRWAELWQPKTLAVAAVTLIAVGVAAVQVLNFLEWPGPSQSGRFAEAAPVSFPASFAAALVATHDNCAKAADHHRVPGNDPVALRDRLTQLEGIPVSAINPGDGWQFKGAAFCTVETTKTVHLLYARGNEAVSIFSLPAPASCHESSYEQVISNHPLAGFTNQGALYCVVGSTSTGQLTIAQIAPLVAQVKTSLGIVADCGAIGDVSIQTASAMPTASPAPRRQ
jgi:hypothetical protein